MEQTAAHVALVKARAYIEKDRDALLQEACRLGPDGQPDRTTMATGDANAVAEIEALLQEIDDALSPLVASAPDVSDTLS